MLNSRRRLAALTSLVLLGTMTHAASAAEKEIVAYRLTEWKTLHFHDGGKANTHYETVKKLGCEVKKQGHGDHVDVAYRCPQWRQISLTSHEHAHGWERWLKNSGFEVRHEH
ncbi:MAG: hypothetical protein ACREJB_06235 [Planctomycetaceae bacterium]